ncbi:hypothetical protein [Nostocoides sp. HKS02]|uniref:hypothetical protein n=1 Tax=Nostocoides sp. HKS02 TaxID=1813880 RepID=UPI0012B4A340|nr:hypothetical protein [Tetrasphaera sp. HKS02]QGN58966.1 hypothetical protein GKE56_14910 [Tetrasphaera sp. HKS02]
MATDPPGLSRRLVVKGAVWTTPAVILATAAPAAAASNACTPAQLVTDWTSAAYTRTSPTTGVYTWVNPLGNGSVPVLTLTVTATIVGPTFSTVNPNNLSGTAGPIGGTPGPGLDLGLTRLRNTTNTTVTGADYSFAFSQPVLNASFTIADIDGTAFNGNSNNAGAERVFLTSTSAMAGTVQDTAYLTGTGTSADPWRRRPNSVPTMASLPNTSTAGDVPVTAAALSQFTVGYRLLDNTSTGAANYNVWLTPILVTLPCP